MESLNKIKQALESLVSDRYKYSDNLPNIKIIKPDLEDWQLSIKVSVFNMDIKLYSLDKNLVSRTEYDEFADVEEYSFLAIKDSKISQSNLRSISNVSEILFDAKLLKETKRITLDEFNEIFMAARIKLFRVYSSIKKSYASNQKKEKPIPLKSLQNIRARVATLNNEN